MTLLFHKLQKDALENVRLHGLKIGPMGDKRDAAIQKADEFLNQYIPSNFQKLGIDRITNIFCYLANEGKVIDITSGEKSAPSELPKSSDQCLLEIRVDPRRCYVSDLDLYDEIKQLLQDNRKSEAGQLAEIYWKRLRLLADYHEEFRRPEVMVTHPIAPSVVGESY